MIDIVHSIAKSILSPATDAVGSVLDRLNSQDVDVTGARQKAQEGADSANTASFYSPQMQEALPWIKAASKANGVAPSLLMSMYAQESSAGTDKASYNPDIGENAWRMGLTADALKNLKDNGLPHDASTPEGAINAAAAYASLRSKVYDYDSKTDTKTPTKQYDTNDPSLYLDRYVDPTRRDKIADSFKKRADYYSGFAKDIDVL